MAEISRSNQRPARGRCSALRCSAARNRPTHRNVQPRETRRSAMDEIAFNEETFNLELRKFLKKVGISAQREIERVVREAARAGTLRRGGHLQARMTLSIAELKLT